MTSYNLPMDWLRHGIVIMIMFVWPPISLTEIVLPNLSNIDTTYFSGLPTIILVSFYLCWLVDYGSVFFLLHKWTK